MKEKNYGITHCPYCEKQLPTDEDWESDDDGDHLCWHYPHCACEDGNGVAWTAEEKLCQVLKECDILKEFMKSKGISIIYARPK